MELQEIKDKGDELCLRLNALVSEFEKETCAKVELLDILTENKNRFLGRTLLVTILYQDSSS